MQTRSQKPAPQEPTRPTQVRKRKRQDVHTSQADSQVEENLHPLEQNTEPIEGEGDREAANATHHSTQDVGFVTGTLKVIRLLSLKWRTCWVLYGVHMGKMQSSEVDLSLQS